MIIIYKRILSRCKRLLNFYNHYLINFIYPFPFWCLGKGTASQLLERAALPLRYSIPISCTTKKGMTKVARL